MQSSSHTEVDATSWNTGALSPRGIWLCSFATVCQCLPQSVLDSGCSRLIRYVLLPRRTSRLAATCVYASQSSRPISWQRLRTRFALRQYGNLSGRKNALNNQSRRHPEAAMAVRGSLPRPSYPMHTARHVSADRNGYIVPVVM